MTIYRVPMRLFGRCEVYGYVTVSAETAKEALEKSLEGDFENFVEEGRDMDVLDFWKPDHEDIKEQSIRKKRSG